MTNRQRKTITTVFTTFGVLIIAAIFWSGFTYSTVEENHQRSLQCMEKIEKAATKEDLKQLEDNMKFFIREIMRHDRRIELKAGE